MGAGPWCEGLTLAPLVGEAEVEVFLGLCHDEHIRGFLLDGEVLPREWASAAVAESRVSFAERGVGLWLVRAAGTAIGFCGFRVFPTLSPEPQLLYALLPRVTGRGHATRLARALLSHVAALGWARVEAAVDAPNTASVRVLEKCGFARCGAVPGVFGDTLLFEWLAQPRERFEVAPGARRALVIESTWDGARAEGNEVVAMTLELGLDELVVHVEAPFHGDAPPSAPPGPTDGLWNHEVVELMLLGADDRYVELELGPHGHHLALLLEGYRERRLAGMELHYHAEVEGARWRGRARLPLVWIPFACRRLNAYAMHGVGTHRRYLAWSPRRDVAPGEAPDFHHLSAFGAFSELVAG